MYEAESHHRRSPWLILKPSCFSHPPPTLIVEVYMVLATALNLSLNSCQYRYIYWVYLLELSCL